MEGGWRFCRQHRQWFLGNQWQRLVVALARAPTNCDQAHFFSVLACFLALIVQFQLNLKLSGVVLFCSMKLCVALTLLFSAYVNIEY